MRRLKIWDKSLRKRKKILEMLIFSFFSSSSSSSFPLMIDIKKIRSNTDYYMKHKKHFKNDNSLYIHHTYGILMRIALWKCKEICLYLEYLSKVCKRCSKNFFIRFYGLMKECWREIVEDGIVGMLKILWSIATMVVFSRMICINIFLKNIEA